VVAPTRDRFQEGRGSTLAGADPMARGALVGALALQVRDTGSRDRSNPRCTT